MVGGSPKHNLISLNVGASLNLQLRDRNCFVYSSDQRVKAARTKLYTYPDITIVCGEPEYFEGDTLTNPTVIIEVLSPSTQEHDRGLKFNYYRQIAALQDYLLIVQNAPHGEHYPRTNDWQKVESYGLDPVIELPSIGCTLALSDVYRKITFGEAV